MGARRFAAGVWRGLAAVAAMAVVSCGGVGLLLAGTDAGAAGRVRATAAVVSMAVGAPADVAVTGLSIPAPDRSSSQASPAPDRSSPRPSLLGRFTERAGGRIGMPEASLAGRIGLWPLGVTVAGAATLAGLLLVPWSAGPARRRGADLVRGFGAVAGFAGAVAVCSAAGPTGPIRFGAASVTVAPDRLRAVLGALLLAAAVVGAGLAARGGWRRPVLVVATVLGGLAVAGTAVAAVAGAPAGGARAAGLGVLAGANVPLAAVPWGSGVPWTSTMEGRAGPMLADRLRDRGSPAPALADRLPDPDRFGPALAGRPWWLFAVVAVVLLLCWFAAAPGSPGRARSGAGPGSPGGSRFPAGPGSPGKALLTAGSPGEARLTAGPGSPGGAWFAGAGWPARARFAVVTGVAFAVLAAVTGLSVTAAVQVAFLRVPAVDAALHGSVPAAAVAGLLAGGLVALVPVPRLRPARPARPADDGSRERHGNPARGR